VSLISENGYDCIGKVPSHVQKLSQDPASVDVGFAPQYHQNNEFRRMWCMHGGRILHRTKIQRSETDVKVNAKSEAAWCHMHTGRKIQR